MENKRYLIYADDAKRAIEHYDPAFAYVIDNIAPVDAKEVIHSMWTFNATGSGTCQHCHRTTKNVWDYDSWMRHCPDCGARMDGGKNEKT
jgi:hypothetical protein